MNKYVFIDRDGVINKDLWKYVEYWEEFEFLPKVLDAIKLLTDAGYQLLIISNQAGVGDGIFTAEALRDVDKQMVHAIEEQGSAVAGTYYCIHGKQANCDCRKPKTGLFEEAMKAFPDIKKEKTYFIGDKISDIGAGNVFGLKTIMVLTGYGERDQEKITEMLKPEVVLSDLYEAANYIINKEKDTA